MERAIDVRTERPHEGLAAHAPNYRRRSTRVLFGLACVAAATFAQAQQSSGFDAAAESATDTPWLPAVIAAVDEYVPSPAFNGGRLSLDHFADSNSADQQGLVTAQLANGNIVVAGLVPDGTADAGFCGDGTRLCSIGLVRYTPTGQRVTWPNAGTNGRYSDNYVVWPGGSAANRYQYLRDVKVRGALIDVLVDRPDVSRSGLGRADVVIATFKDTGDFVGFGTVFGASGSGSESEDFYGAQMVQMDSSTMIVAATAFDSIGPYVAVTRLVTASNQTPTKDANWGLPYNAAPNSFYVNRLIRYFAPSSYCGGGACDATAGYLAKQEGFPVQTDFYVAGSMHISGNNWDPYALKISSADGSTKSEFNTTGWSRAPFDEANSSLDDRAAGLYVYQDDVYLAAQVSRKCFPGVGLAKINGATGAYNAAFGGGGKTVFGGQGNAPICFSPPGGDYPTAISATGGRIGIAGYSHHGITGISNFYDPMLAVVNAVDASVLDFGFHAVKRADGTRYGDAVLYGIYGGALPTSPFTVAGNGRDALSGNTLSYVAGRFIPVSSDRIFTSGFGIGDEH
ncbi:MAG: hypothetical protein ABIO49_11120 [Dokdonella sp.]